MIYYNAVENIIGFTLTVSDKIVRIQEDNNVFRVLTGHWELVGKL